MANINFGILDTQLPGRIAAIPQEAQKQQTANMLQAMQVQGAMRQNEMSQMQLDELKSDRAEMVKLQQAMQAKGGSPDLGQYADMLMRSPKHMQLGIQLKQKIDAQARFAEAMREEAPIATPGPTNALAPSAAPPANALAVPADPTAAMRQRRNRLIGIDTDQARAAVKSLDADIRLASRESPDISTMRALGYPNTQAGYEAFRAAQRTERADRLLTPDEEAQRVRIALASRPPAQPRPEQPAQPVIDPDTGKQILVSREEAIRRRMAPANAAEGLAPKEIQKREAALPAATSAVTGFETKSKSFVKDLETLRDHPGLSSITGIAAGRMPGLTADGRAAQALYDKIVAKGGFQALQDLRDASKTGGALGNVSNQEGKQLTASFAAIDRRQDAADVQAAINQAIADIEGARTRTREAYDSTYSYKSAAGQAAPAGAGKPSLDDIFGGKKP